MNIESYSEVIDLMQRRRERKCVNYNVYLQIKEFTCEPMYHNNIVIKIKMSQSLT